MFVKITQINLATKKATRQRITISRCLQNPRMRRIEEREKRKVTRKGREFFFLLKTDRSRKRKRVLPMFVDILKRWTREASRSFHSLRLPGWIKLRERKEGKRKEEHLRPSYFHYFAFRAFLLISIVSDSRVDLSSSANLGETSVPHPVRISIEKHLSLSLWTGFSIVWSLRILYLTLRLAAECT